MSANPLKSVETAENDRSKWTPQEHCDHANAQLILKGIHDERRAKGYDPVKWVVIDRRVVMVLA